MLRFLFTRTEPFLPENNLKLPQEWRVAKTGLKLPKLNLFKIHEQDPLLQGIKMMIYEKPQEFSHHEITNNHETIIIRVLPS